MGRYRPASHSGGYGIAAGFGVGTRIGEANRAVSCRNRRRWVGYPLPVRLTFVIDSSVSKETFGLRLIDLDTALRAIRLS